MQKYFRKIFRNAGSKKWNEFFNKIKENQIKGIDRANYMKYS